MKFFVCLFFAVAAHASDFYSQASQDEFVYTMLYRFLGKSDPGYYLEIGAAGPIGNNNSYYFEKNSGWKGISIDIDKKFENQWHESRTNRLCIEDATRVDYAALLRPFPKIIDYLSLDIDSQYDVVLKKIPLDRYVFKVITIEHDYYRFGESFRTNEREILLSQGYELLCPDVSALGNCFEDWWIHPSAFPPALLQVLRTLDMSGKDHKDLIAELANINLEK